MLLGLRDVKAVAELFLGRVENLVKLVIVDNHVQLLLKAAF